MLNSPRHRPGERRKSCAEICLEQIGEMPRDDRDILRVGAERLVEIPALLRSCSPNRYEPINRCASSSFLRHRPCPGQINAGQIALPSLRLIFSR